MSVLKTEDLRQLPNSKWLQDVLSLDIESEQIFYDDEKQFQEAFEPCSYEELKNTRNSFKEGLEMMNNVLKKCTKTGNGEPIYFTKKEWDWVSNLIFDEGICPWDVGEEPNMSDKDHIIWLDSYHKYVNIVEKEKMGFRFPGCGCRAGYECKFAYVKIRDGDVCKTYKRNTGNIHDDQKAIDAISEGWLEKGCGDRKSVYIEVYGNCPQCLVPYGGIHHINCSYERCPICNPDPEPTCSSDYSHQFIMCAHNDDAVYCKGSEDQGLFDRGFNYHLAVNDDRIFEIPISRWERVWLRGFLESVIDTRSKSVNDPDFKASEIQSDLSDDIEVARDILAMLDKMCQSLTLTGGQLYKFGHVLVYQSHLHGCKDCKDSIIAKNKRWDRYDNDPLQDDDYNYLIEDELKPVDKFLDIITKSLDLKLNLK